MTFEFSNITKNLELRNGIWYSKNSANLSYPEEGNDRSFKLENNSFWFRHRNNCIIETVKNFSPNGVIFDVGGGNGYVSYGLEKSGLKTVLMEPGQNGVLNAKQRGLKNIICSTIEDAAIEPGSLDAIGVFDVVEHIKDDLTFFNMLRKHLKPGGMLFITVPAFMLLWSMDDKEGGHYRRYTLKSLNKILKQAEFKTVYSTYIFSILPLPIFFFRTLPGKLKMIENPLEYQKNKKIHEAGNENFFKGLEKIWKWEINKIRNNEKISFGGSCLVVAKKI